MNRTIVLKTKIYISTISSYENLADLIIDNTGNPIDAFIYLRDLEASYPNFYKWYHQTVIGDIKKGVNGRCMLFAFSDVFEEGYISKKLTGLAILKSTKQEKKICTIRVFSKDQKQGIGSALIKRCIRYLKTQKPLITISEFNIKYFSSFIRKYNWSLVQVLPDYYKEGVVEYVYNGRLLNSKELQMFLQKHLKKTIQKNRKIYFRDKF